MPTGSVKPSGFKPEKTGMNDKVVIKKSKYLKKNRTERFITTLEISAAFAFLGAVSLCLATRYNPVRLKKA